MSLAVLKRLAALIAVLVALLGAALWLGPRFLDWESQRGRLAALAAAQIGRPVALEGPLSLAVLPQPMLEAADVVIGGGPGNVAVTARVLRLRLDLFALLVGRLEPREVVLVGADIRLPWPPASTSALRPPPWLTGFDATLQDSRLRVGEATLEGVSARLSAGGLLEAVRAQGEFAWRGFSVRFSAAVGRPGHDGVGTLDLTLATAGASATARGVLVAEGGFEGRIEAAGPDLSIFVPAPSGSFRAAGRLTVVADLLAADDLALDLAGVPGRGAVALRLAPQPRLDIALAASRLDLDAWIAALRAAAVPPLPTGLDLSAEAASLQGLTLRRLRGAVFREADRVTLSDVSALLPGDAEVELTGATAGERLELGLRFVAPNLRVTLGALGLPVAAADPARLRQAEGRARLVIEGGQVSVPELAGTLDESRLSGAGVLRFGPRPALGLGLTLDRLELDGLLPSDPDWGKLAGKLGTLDANLRIAAERLVWRGMAAERVALDAALETGRVTVRRLSGQIDGADIGFAGALTLSPALRFADLSLEVSAPATGGLLALLPPGWPRGTRLAELPLVLRATGGGPADALALRMEAELDQLRLETDATLNLVQGRGTGTLTVRHPGAPRLLAMVLGGEPPPWLGEGSLSLIATLEGTRNSIGAEKFELVAADLRARGQLMLALGEARPQLTGRIMAEHLPLPDLDWRAEAPLSLAALRSFDVQAELEASAVAGVGLPPVKEARAVLQLAEGRLQLSGLRAQLGGGALEGQAQLDAAAAPPRLAATIHLTGATIAGPLLHLPFDLSAGTLEARAQVAATGHSPSAMLATLTGEAHLTVRNGVLVGLDLEALASAMDQPDAAAAEAGLRAALEGGATAFEQMGLSLRLAEGRAELAAAEIAGNWSVTAGASGTVDLARGMLDLRLTARQPVPGAPEVVLRLTGPAAAPRRLPEVAPWALWRAEKG